MKKVAVIVETRTGDKYVEAIKQHAKHLKGWFIVMATTRSAWKTFYEHKFKDTGIISGSFSIGEIDTANDYNHLLTRVWFWKALGSFYDKVLIFQHDSGILKNNADEFLKYDYVGAPWGFQNHGGNGGLSIRNPKVMFEICKEYPWNSNLGNEDVYFCNIMHKYGIGKLAPREVCSRFSVETIYAEGTFGYHAIDKYLSDEQVEFIKSQEE